MSLDVIHFSDFRVVRLSVRYTVSNQVPFYFLQVSTSEYPIIKFNSNENPVVAMVRCTI
jgi:hypothetical protein